MDLEGKLTKAEIERDDAIIAELLEGGRGRELRVGDDTADVP
jgi:hypothetical protein